MKSGIVFAFASLISVALSAKLDLQSGRPPMYPGRKSSQAHQSLVCYDGPNQTGTQITLTDYCSNLGYSPFYFDNRASSCCFNGIWILYDQYDYNLNNFQMPEFHAWGENYCTNFDSAFDNKASSARLAGAPDGYKYDTLNFYDGENFMGREQYTYGDAAVLNYDNFGRSLIVSGCTAWTIYQNVNYQGACYCVFPQSTSNCYPGFYPTASLLGGLSQQISSARRGCFCSKHIYPENFDKKGIAAHEGEFAPK